MPNPPSAHPDPAMRAYIEQCGGVTAFVAKHGLSVRTAQRILSGAIAAPHSLRLQCLGSSVIEAENRP